MDERKIMAEKTEFELENQFVRVKYEIYEAYPDDLISLKEKIQNLEVNKEFEAKMDIKSDLEVLHTYFSIEFEKTIKEDVTNKNIYDINVGIREIMKEEGIELSE